MRKLLLILLLAPLLSFGYVKLPNIPHRAPISMYWQDAPVFGIQDVFRDSLVLSWTIPAGSVTTVVERSTNRSFTPLTTVYNGASTTQIKIETGLTQHTWYYYRIRCLDAGSNTSGWVTDSVRTFWTPTAASQGGHRVATSADLSIDPFINVGDYLIVGSDSYAETDGWGASVGGYMPGMTVPALTTPGAKVCIIGGTGYDFVNINMINNRGKTITVVGGQLKARLGFFNMKQVTFTGKYDPVAKTGNALFKGFDDPNNWNKLSGSFVVFMKGRWDHPEVLLSHMGGATDSSTFEYLEGGMGGSSAFTVKNDGDYHPMTGNTIQKLYIHDTGDEGFYIGSTQQSPQTPIVDFHINNIIIARAGLNALQIGQLKGFNWVHNLAIVGAGFEYNNAFMKYQDQAVQIQPRHMGWVFDSTIVAGGSGDFINYFWQQEIPPDEEVPPRTWTRPADYVHDAPATSHTSYMRNNLYYNNKNRGVGFMQAHKAFAGTVNMTDNFIGGMGSKKSSFDAYSQLYVESYTKRSTLIGTVSDGGSTFTHNSNNNTIDTAAATSPTIMQAATGGTITQTNTTQVNNLQPLIFNNYMDHMVDTNYSMVERWMDKQATKWVRIPLNSCCGYRDSRFGTRFQEIRDNNISSSTNSYTLPGILGTTITPTVGTGLAYQAGEKLFFYNGSLDATPNFYATINNYNPANGALSLTVDSVTGSGTYNSWAVRQEIQDIIIRRTYRQNDIVRHEGRFYISLQNNNTSHVPPTSGTWQDSWWKLIIFSNGRTMPPDDLRVSSSSYYGQRGIGLSTQVSSEVKYRKPLPSNYNFQYRKR